ncbi:MULTISPECIES: zinc-dependent alcohol dehydrogenase family protein [unclassified Nocardioides]|uniref:zinc-dependent alcohol dehydrogenase family protein n=1 Tax=unclassified Nocardioides TaxID=2615069 RepID=UPI000702469D|nr:MULTISPECIES: zinc-dependent alcohol dehydrogenase family protein [unclassified Nocardioides]KQP64895.1 IMP dehydrogenase [Nocardioides sp. Leaf285]KQQ43915.1 IMP dehydrogenase [Nocardioides sp. Leaf307]MCM3515255.1 zinc-dependent alcohol dehydrogenase family protein [Nocardioides sp. P86]
MKATTIHAARDIRFEEVPDARVEQPTDAVVRVTTACICGSDLWPYRGENPIKAGSTIGHECIGVVEEVGSSVSQIRVGDFVVVPFDHCDNTCAHCRAGMQSACVDLSITQSGQGELARVGHADGSLVRVDGVLGDGRPDPALVPSLMALSDVMPTGWHAAVSAGVAEGGTAVVVGDGAVGLCGVLAASMMGAEKVVVMSRHESRQRIARDFGATHVVATRGEEGEAEVMEITGGVGADAVLECVGTDQAMRTAFTVARPGSTVGFVGVPHGVELPIRRMFSHNVGLAGGMAPVRRYLPELLDHVLAGRIDPGLVFDLTLPMDQVAEGYAAMDERRATKVLLQP